MVALLQRGAWIAVEFAGSEQARGRSVQTARRGESIDAVRAVDVTVQLPAQTVVQREVRIHAERILKENAALGERKALRDRRVFGVLVGLFVHVL